MGRVIVALLALVWGIRGTLGTRFLRTRWRVGSLGMESNIPDMICGNGSLSIEGPAVVRYPRQLVADIGGLVPTNC